METKARKKHGKIVVPGQISTLPSLGKRDSGWLIVGFDCSMSSLAGAAWAYDRVLDRQVGPAFVLKRWPKDTHYFERLKDAARSYELVLELQAELGISLGVEDVHIAQEEPFPPHMNFIGKAQSGFLKQQAEISGAFLGGLLRYGYQSIWQLSNVKWRQTVANDLGITIHHSKWSDPALVEVFNCLPKYTGKFRAKQWALKSDLFQNGVPDWPDIIESAKLGKIPRPEGSQARAVQPDDRYDALAIMVTLRDDLEKLGAFDEMAK